MALSSHTHSLEFRGPLLTKTYASWQRDEHRREWTVLRRVGEHAPGLAPHPVEARLDERPPAITMAVVPGEPVGATPSGPQRAALVEAVTRLWAVPHHGLPPWIDDLPFARHLTAAPRPAGGVLADAYDAALDWWAGPDPGLLARRPPRTVLGHRDPNLTNYLWDGRRIRIVDFEDAAVSDPATEVAIMMEHLAWRAVPVDDLAARFGIDSGRLPAARRLWAMFWLWLLRPGGRSAHRNPPGTAEAQARRLLHLLGH